MFERLGEDVRELPTSVDELDDDLPSIDTIPEEVELDVDVFLRLWRAGFVARAMAGWLSTISAGG